MRNSDYKNNKFQKFLTEQNDLTRRSTLHSQSIRLINNCQEEENLFV